jgi:hypothetical protein
MEETDFKNEIKKHEQARFFCSEGLKGLLELIQQTRPDVVLGIDLIKAKEPKAESFGMSSYDVKEWNAEWVRNAQVIIQKLWDSGILMSNDIERILRNLTNESKTASEAK